MSIDPTISVRNLDKVYMSRGGEKVVALKGVSFIIEVGEFVAVVGPSGCGKTTLLKILGGLINRTSGEVVLNGISVNGPRRDIGIVFQNPVLLPWRNVIENALLPIEVLHLSKHEYMKSAKELIYLVGLENFEEKYPFELSGGMQQRNALVRALIFDPSLLLMDEPFGALDAMTREIMNLELLRIWEEKKKTVFFITHSIPEAVFLADRVLVMGTRPGKIVGTIKINLPRPRNRDSMSLPQFGDFTKEVRNLFYEQEVS
jgi:NitT/TauT family transport system ATP-binding protein